MSLKIADNGYGFVSVVAIGLLLLVSAQKPNRITKAEYQHISHHSTKPMLPAVFFGWSSKISSQLK